MPVAVASLALICALWHCWSPPFLDEPRAANIAAIPASVVSAFALQLVLVEGIRYAGIGVSVTHTTTTDADVFDTVEVPSGDGRILPLHRHQVAKQGFRAEKTQSDVGSFAPLLQGWCVREVFRARAVFDHRYNHLAAFKRDHVGVLGRADDAVVAGNFLERVDSEKVVTITVAVCKILPRLEGIAMVR